ncbi:hypothetical protein FWG76_02005 [Candidatus Saccharibacteria bacterium]|nr:hypothetical protein [Candidatus Saccharibacteria bacterium]
MPRLRTPKASMPRRTTPRKMVSRRKMPRAARPQQTLKRGLIFVVFALVIFVSTSFARTLPEAEDAEPAYALPMAVRVAYASAAVGETSFEASTASAEVDETDVEANLPSTDEPIVAGAALADPTETGEAELVESVESAVSTWILPDEVWVHIPGQNRARLTAAQMGRLSDIHRFFAIDTGLAPHIVAAFAGSVGQEGGFRDQSARSNGHFGDYQLDDYLYRAYQAWCRENGSETVLTDAYHQSAFVWACLNGWGEGEWFNEGWYRQTLVDLLASETVREAVVILNAGRDGNPSDGVDGFFRGNLANRVPWAEQIHEQFVEVRP